MNIRKENFQGEKILISQTNEGWEININKSLYTAIVYNDFIVFILPDKSSFNLFKEGVEDLYHKSCQDSADLAWQICENFSLWEHPTRKNKPFQYGRTWLDTHDYMGKPPLL